MEKGRPGNTLVAVIHIKLSAPLLGTEKNEEGRDKWEGQTFTVTPLAHMRNGRTKSLHPPVYVLVFTLLLEGADLLW